MMGPHAIDVVFVDDEACGSGWDAFVADAVDYDGIEDVGLHNRILTTFSIRYHTTHNTHNIRLKLPPNTCLPPI